MKILGIETSCDETAIAIVETSGGKENPRFLSLSQALSSQVELHAKWGGVVPSLAKREHAKNLTPLLKEALVNARLEEKKNNPLSEEKKQEVATLLYREEGLAEQLIFYLEQIEIPDIEIISVTYGPGLEPALWVGVNFAKALAVAWDKPIVPVNHMEGHIVSVLLSEKEGENPKLEVEFPAIALLVSGGHTELVLVSKWGEYKIIGETRDDAIGEAFDKVARILGLPYPGGPKIAELAKEAREEKKFNLPRPMIHSGDLDFSFSGLKTAVLYAVKDKDLTDDDRASIAKEFQEAAIEVVVSKTFKALEEHNARTLIVGGGVIANQKLREKLDEKAKSLDINFLMPEMNLTTDNATMIAMAGYLHEENPVKLEEIIAVGNLRLGN